MICRHQGWQRVERLVEYCERVDCERVERRFCLQINASSESSRICCSKMRVEQHFYWSHSHPRARAQPPLTRTRSSLLAQLKHDIELMYIVISVINYIDE